MHSEKELIQEIKRISQEYCNGNTPTQTDIQKHSSISSSTYARRFSSWEEVILKAGFDCTNSSYTKKQLEEELHRVSEKYCDGEAPKRSDMDKHGQYSPSTYRNRFNSWSEALEEFNYIPNKKKVGFTKEELLQDLERIMQKDSVPIPLREKDIDEHSKYSHGTYENYFGSVSSAIEKLGIEPRTSGVGEEHWCWVDGYDGYYGKNWYKQRRKAWKRDDYKCSVCGSKNNGKLENPDVHHIEPSKNFNSETEYEEMNCLDNLVCLCRTHHNQFGDRWEELDYESFVEKAKEQA